MTSEVMSTWSGGPAKPAVLAKHSGREKTGVLPFFSRRLARMRGILGGARMLVSAGRREES